MARVATRPLVVILLAALPLLAQVPVTGTKVHGPLLASTNPHLAANKRLVYDFWREVLDAGHLELAGKYLSEDYIQHNPTVPTGRAGFVAHFSKFTHPSGIRPDVKASLVSIVAEGDLVIVASVAEIPDPDHVGKKYTTTWFDMFRIEHGKIAEHWDSMIKG